jgi:hypothetical protein
LDTVPAWTTELSSTLVQANAIAQQDADVAREWEGRELDCACGNKCSLPPSNCRICAHLLCFAIDFRDLACNVIVFMGLEGKGAVPPWEWLSGT